ncbi:PrpR N-terminal domain-containing protein [Streptococcus thoraltensis]
MSNVRLLGIAPYEELRESMATIASNYDNITLDVYTADLEEAITLVKKLNITQYDAIISRGGTAQLIQKAVKIPVIEVSISLYDILSVIQLAQNYSQKFAIVGYSNITETAHLLANILKYNISIITLHHNSDTKEILSDLQNKQFDLILCDAVTNKTALQMSLNTLLITSGQQSIKKAYNDAIERTQYIKAVQNHTQLLQTAFYKQNSKILIMSKDFQSIFSNIDAKHQKAIMNYLKDKIENDNPKYYHTYQSQTYHLNINVIDDNHYLIEIKETTPPMINHQFGIEYLDKKTVAERLSTDMSFSSFITPDMKEKIQKAQNHYHAILITGETGTFKTSLAYTSFLSQKNNQSQLIVIKSQLINDKTWKYLLNPSNGPLMDSNITFLFKNIDQLPLIEFDKLMTIISNTKLLQRNNIIFTYTIKKDDDNQSILNHLNDELDFYTTYSPSVRERQTEISSIVTLLLNKINIENNRDIVGFEPGALQLLTEFDFPGNFNQLYQILKQVAIATDTYYISSTQIETSLNLEKNKFDNLFESEAIKDWINSNRTLFDYSKEIIRLTLDKNNGNQTKTAKQLGISRTTLWRYLNQ